MRVRFAHFAFVGLVGVVAAWIGCAFDTSGLLPVGGGGSTSSSGTSGPSTTSSGLVITSSSTTSGSATTSSSSGGASTSSSTGSTSSSSGGCPPDGGMVVCYTGDAGNENVGLCMPGTAACPWNGTAATCIGEITPIPENCAAMLDQDCNGSTPPCTGAVGPGGRAWGEGMDEGLAVAFDPQGDVIVAGYFSGMLDFGKGPVAAVMPPDAFVAKYDKSANLVWMTHFGQMGPQQVNAVAVDAAGDVIVAGAYGNAMSLPTSTATPLPVTGGPGMFVAKLDANGDAIWANGYPGGGDGAHPSFAAAVGVAPDGTIAVAGQIGGNNMIGSMAVDTSANSDADGVVFTLDGNGAVGWVEQITDGKTGSFQALYGVAIDANDDVVVTGTGAGNVNFGDGMPVNAPSSGGGNQAIAAALYKKSGSNISIAWKQLYGGSSLSAGKGVAFGPGGDAFVTGSFNGSIMVGSQALTAGGADVFVTRLGSAMGVPAWATSFPGGSGSDDESGTGIAVDAYSVVVGGYFRPTLTVGTLATIMPGGTYGAFVTKLLVDGTPLWVQQPQGGSNGNARGMAVALDTSTTDPPGSSALAGFFTGSIGVNGVDAGVDAGMGAGNIFFERFDP